VKTVENPFAVFRSECEAALESALRKVLPEIEISNMALEKPPNTDFGELASSLCFELAKKIGQKPIDLAKNLAKNTDKTKFFLIEKVSSAGGGYVNFHLDFAKFSALTLNSIMKLDDQYGFTDGVGYQRPHATRNDLVEAVNEVLANKPVSVPETNAIGCQIGRVRKANEASEVTYSKQIARIFQQNCVECHRAGRIGPGSQEHPHG